MALSRRDHRAPDQKRPKLFSRKMLLADVLAVISLFVGFWLTGWATITIMSLLFGRQAEAAAVTIQTSPVKSGLIGAGMVATLGVLSVIFMLAPLPLGKVIGAVMFMFLFMVSFLGTAGICHIAARRVTEGYPGLAPFAALSRAAAILVTASMLPVVGWLFIAPLIVFVSLGAGTRSLMRRKPVMVMQNGTSPS